MNMKAAAVLLLTLLIAGCADPKPADTAKSTTTTVRRGRDCDSSKVKDIQKGKTSTQEIIQWFGQPYAKKIVSTNQVGWLYSWRQSIVTVNRSGATVKGKETGFRKRLELLIGDDVVMNYTFEEGPYQTDGNRDAK